MIESKSNNQLITDSEDEKAKKELKRAAKRKTQHDNLYAFMLLAFNAGFTSPSLSCLHMPTLLSRPPIFTSLSLPIPASSSFPVPASPSRSMLGPAPTHLQS